jgi:hypothetical protein
MARYNFWAMARRSLPLRTITMTSGSLCEAISPRAAEPNKMMRSGLAVATIRATRSSRSCGSGRRGFEVGVEGLMPVILPCTILRAFPLPFRATVATCSCYLALSRILFNKREKGPSLGSGP